MDKRIGYGLTLEEAIKRASEAIKDLTDEDVQRLEAQGHFSIGGGIIWGENRDDGWRVYRKKKEGEFHL